MNSIALSTFTARSNISTDKPIPGCIYRYAASPRAAIVKAAREMGVKVERQTMDKYTILSQQSRAGKVRPCLVVGRGLLEDVLIILTTLDGFKPYFSCLATQMFLVGINGTPNWEFPLRLDEIPPAVHVQPVAQWVARTGALSPPPEYLLALPHPRPYKHYGLVTYQRDAGGDSEAFTVDAEASSQLMDWSQRQTTRVTRMTKQQRQTIMADSYQTSVLLQKAFDKLKTSSTADAVWNVQRKYHDHLKLRARVLPNEAPSDFTPSPQIRMSDLPLPYRHLLPSIPPFGPGIQEEKLNAGKEALLVTQLLHCPEMSMPFATVEERMLQFFLRALNIIGSCPSCVVHPALWEASVDEIRAYIFGGNELPVILGEMLTPDLPFQDFTISFTKLRRGICIETLSS